MILLLTLSSCSSSPSKTYKLIGYDKIADQITGETAKKIEKQTGLRLIGTGGGSASGHLRELNMSFQYSQAMNMKRGRKLLIYCVNEYLAAINGNEEIRAHLIHFPFTPEDVEINIFIRQPDNSVVPIGSLVAVSERSGKLSYHTRQPDPIIMKKIHEETFEEALKLVATSEELEIDQSPKPFQSCDNPA